MSAELFLSLLEARAEGFLLDLEKNESVGLDFSPPAQLSQPGPYFFLRSPSVPDLWRSFHLALRENLVLVITGPLSPEAETILLRQLPAEPPPGARLVLFTSGSTGDPKAVFHGEASLLTSARQLSAAFPLEKAQLSLLPPWGMAGIAFHLLLPLLQGRRLYFHGGPFLEWAPRLEGLAPELDLLSLNPFLLEMAMRAGLPREIPLVSLTAPLSETMKEKLAGSPASEIYGMTEAAGPILRDGKSLGAKLELSEAGELRISGEQLFLGYGKEGQFQSRDEWFATGDIFVKHPADQNWQFVARERDLIDVGGRKIAPRLIEEVFLGMAEMNECLALPVQLEAGERAGLLYVRNKSCELDEKSLSMRIGEWARTSLSLDMRPFLWREVRELPRLPNGKVDKVQARKLISSGKGDISRA